MIPIEQIKEENKLTQAFIWLQGNEESYKGTLEEKNAAIYKRRRKSKGKNKRTFFRI